MHKAAKQMPSSQSVTLYVMHTAELVPTDDVKASQQRHAVLTVCQLYSCAGDAESVLRDDRVPAEMMFQRLANVQPCF